MAWMSSEVAVKPLPRRGRLWVVAPARAGAVRARLRDRQASRPRRPDDGDRPRRRDRRSPGTLRRHAAGRRPARLRRRAGDDPGLQRPAVLELPRRLPRDDPGADRKLRPPRRRQAALPPLLEQRNARASSASTAPRRPPTRATAGSTSTSSSATRKKPKRFGSRALKTSSTRSPAGSRNSTSKNGNADLEENGGSDGPIAEAARRLRGTRPQPRHPHRPGDGRQRPERHARRCRKARRWPKSKRRSPKSNSRSRVCHAGRG